MKSVEPLQPGRYYHIFNRGNNREDLFREERNYAYFLQLYAKYIHPIADTCAYCLMRNHFHVLLKIREVERKTSQVSQTCEVLDTPRVSQHFSNFFNAYSKAINKAYARTGSLFEERFGRIEVTSERYFAQLVFYIHFNPQKHGFVDDFREWPWSSYHSLYAIGETKLDRDKVLNWFGGSAQYKALHQGLVEEKTISALIAEDFE